MWKHVLGDSVFRVSKNLKFKNVFETYEYSLIEKKMYCVRIEISNFFYKFSYSYFYTDFKHLKMMNIW